MGPGEANASTQPAAGADAGACARLQPAGGLVY